MTTLTSKRVTSEQFEYFSIALPLTVGDDEILDAAKELHVFYENYHGVLPFEEFLAEELEQIQLDGKLVLRFSTYYQMTGTNRHPLIYPDAVDARTLIR